MNASSEIADATPLEATEYVYVTTSKRYYDMQMFKIGRTINLKGRLSALNCSNPLDEDLLFYVGAIPTISSKCLEGYLHQLLDNYRYRREWFQMPHQQMYQIIAMIKEQQDAAMMLTNTFITASPDETSRTVMPLDEFAQLNIEESSKLNVEAEEEKDAEILEDEEEEIERICPQCKISNA